MSDVAVANTTSALSGKTILLTDTDATITANHTFNRGSGSAPFTVASGAAVVSNLDADKLDGVEGASYARLGSSNAGNLIFVDATYDIGASGATRPRHLYLSGNATIGGSIVPTGGFTIASTSFVPTWTGASSNPAIGNGTLAGRYFQFGKIVFVDIHLAIGSTTTFGSGAWSWALPVTAADTNGQALTASILDNGSQFYAGHGIVATTTTIQLTWDGNAGGFASPTSPFTWATNDVLRMTGFYVAA